MGKSIKPPLLKTINPTFFRSIQMYKPATITDKTQRLLCFLAIPLWTYLWYIDDLAQYPNKTLDIGWAIPTSILLLQVILNNRILWIGIFSIVAIFGTVVMIGSVITLTKGTAFTFSYFLQIAITLGVVFLFYKMKPSKKETPKALTT